MKNTMIFLVSVMFFVSCKKDIDHNNNSVALNKNNPEEAEMAYPNEAKEKVTLPNGVVLTKTKNGVYIFGGDIILTDEQVEILGTAQTKGAILKDITRMWPDGIVNYTFATNATERQKAIIREAMAHWEAKTPIRFVEQWAKNRLEFIYDPGDWSYVGMIGGKQHISAFGSPIHEIGHAVGLIHEQCRHDRDLYINVYPEYTKNEWKGAIEKWPVTSHYVTNSFDFNSVMLYSSWSVSTVSSGKPAMTKKDGSTWVGQRNGLSSRDIVMVNAMYGNHNIWLTSNSELHGEVYGGGRRMEGNMPCTIKASAYSGYYFEGWYENGVKISSNPEYTFIVLGNRDFKANFLSNNGVYHVFTESIFGTVKGSGRYWAGHTCTLTISDIPNGYRFIGWVDTYSRNTLSSNTTYSFKVDKSINIRAQISSRWQ